MRNALWNIYVGISKVFHTNDKLIFKLNILCSDVGYVFIPFQITEQATDNQYILLK